MPNFIVMLYQMGKYLNQTLIYQDVIIRQLLLRENILFYKVILLAWDVFEIKRIGI